MEEIPDVLLSEFEHKGEKVNVYLVKGNKYSIEVEAQDKQEPKGITIP